MNAAQTQPVIPSLSALEEEKRAVILASIDTSAATIEKLTPKLASIDRRLADPKIDLNEENELKRERREVVEELAKATGLNTRVRAGLVAFDKEILRLADWKWQKANPVAHREQVKADAELKAERSTAARAIRAAVQEREVAADDKVKAAVARFDAAKKAGGKKGKTDAQHVEVMTAEAALREAREERLALDPVIAEAEAGVDKARADQRQADGAVYGQEADLEFNAGGKIVFDALAEAAARFANGDRLAAKSQSLGKKRVPHLLENAVGRELELLQQHPEYVKRRIAVASARTSGPDAVLAAATAVKGGGR